MIFQQGLAAIRHVVFRRDWMAPIARRNDAQPASVAPVPTSLTNAISGSDDEATNAITSIVTGIAKPSAIRSAACTGGQAKQADQSRAPRARLRA